MGEAAHDLFTVGEDSEDTIVIVPDLSVLAQYGANEQDVTGFMDFAKAVER